MISLGKTKNCIPAVCPFKDPSGWSLAGVTCGTGIALTPISGVSARRANVAAAAGCAEPTCVMKTCPPLFKRIKFHVPGAAWTVQGLKSFGAVDM